MSEVTGKRGVYWRLKQVGTGEGMGFFRKKISRIDMQDVVTEFFSSRIPLFYKQLSYGLKKIGVECDDLLNDNSRLETFTKIWIISALNISEERQGEEAAYISAEIRYNLTKNDLTNELLGQIDYMISFHDGDENLFNDVSHYIVNHVYPEFTKHIEPYRKGVREENICYVSGMELASCLRGMDFILKDHKLDLSSSFYD